MPGRPEIGVPGGVLFAGLGMWTVVAAVASGGNPLPTLVLLGATAALVFVVGRTTEPKVVLAVVVAVAAALALPVLARLLLRGRPGWRPSAIPTPTRRSSSRPRWPP